MPDDFDDDPPRKARIRNSLPTKPPRRDRDDDDDDRPKGRPRLVGFYRPSEDEGNNGMLCHLLAIFLHFIGPIVIWATKKEESRFVDWHGREALNFSINMLIWALVAAAILTVVAVVTCGFGAMLFPLALCINIYQIVMNIIALNAAKRGEWYRYPGIFRLIPPPEGLEDYDAVGSGDEREYAPADGEGIAAGEREVCAITASTAPSPGAYCWGSNVFGALGNTLQAAFRGYPQLVGAPIS